MSPKHAVVIAGAGPTGMMLAAELALAQVDAVIVEPRATPDPDRSRAGGLHARTIEVLDQRGVADRFLEEGKAMQIQGFGRIPLDISDFPSRCSKVRQFHGAILSLLICSFTRFCHGM